MTITVTCYRLHNVTGLELLCFGFPYCVYAIEGDLFVLTPMLLLRGMFL